MVRVVSTLYSLQGLESQQLGITMRTSLQGVFKAGEEAKSGGNLYRRGASKNIAFQRSALIFCKNATLFMSASTDVKKFIKIKNRCIMLFNHPPPPSNVLGRPSVAGLVARVVKVQGSKLFLIDELLQRRKHCKNVLSFFLFFFYFMLFFQCMKFLYIVKINELRKAFRKKYNKVTKLRAKEIFFPQFHSQYKNHANEQCF